MARMELDDIPDFISITGLLKAQAVTDNAQRLIYMQVSSEDVDQQGERVLSSALAESAQAFLRTGNIDIDHITLIRERGGYKDWMGYEIGRPVDVVVDGARTHVSAQLYAGDTPMAERANQVWDSMTKLQPPARWYPSVGGAVLSKGIEIDPATGAKVGLIKKVRWTNVGLSRTPVNPEVPTVSAMPFGVFVKSWGPGGLVLKDLTAGYGTDSATLTGGGAVRKQSLDRRIQSYWDFRNHFADDIRRKRVRINRKNLTSSADYAAGEYGLEHDEAATYLERFLSDLDRHHTFKQKRTAA